MASKTAQGIPTLGSPQTEGSFFEGDTGIDQSKTRETLGGFPSLSEAVSSVLIDTPEPIAPHKLERLDEDTGDGVIDFIERIPTRPNATTLPTLLDVHEQTQAELGRVTKNLVENERTLADFEHHVGQMIITAEAQNVDQRDRLGYLTTLFRELHSFKEIMHKILAKRGIDSNGDTGAMTTYLTQAFELSQGFQKLVERIMPGIYHPMFLIPEEITEAMHAEISMARQIREELAEKNSQLAEAQKQLEEIDRHLADLVPHTLPGQDTIAGRLKVLKNGHAQEDRRPWPKRLFDAIKRWPYT